jgi:hypothetical protein
MDNNGKTLKLNLIEHFNKDKLKLNDVSINWFQLPTPIKLNERIVRVFYASRQNSKPQIRHSDLEIQVNGKFTVIGKSQKLLLPENAGEWAKDGIYPSSIVKSKNGFNLYTIGWTNGAVKPIFQARIGIINLNFSGDLVSHPLRPILDLSEKDPFFVSGPTVIRSGNSFKMFYISGDAWIKTPYGPDSRYSLSLAKSTDGIRWTNCQKVELESKKNIKNISRVTLLSDDEMLVSIREEDENFYKLVFCEKVNENTWKISKRNIISKEVVESYAAYPFFIELFDKKYIFVNSTDRGESGFSIFEISKN